MFWGGGEIGVEGGEDATAVGHVSAEEGGEHGVGEVIMCGNVGARVGDGVYEAEGGYSLGEGVQLGEARVEAG